MADRTHHVVEGDPAHPLRAVADDAAHAQSKRCQHLGERAAVFAQHDAQPQVHHAYPLGDRRGCGGFPVPTNLGQKARARPALFGQHLVSPAAVVADPRSADEDSGRLREPGQCLDQEPSGGRAALANAPLLRRRPSDAHDALAGEVDDRVADGRTGG